MAVVLTEAEDKVLSSVVEILCSKEISDKRKIREIANVLKDNPDITAVRIRLSEEEGILTEKDLAILAKVLSRNTTIKVLDLSESGITDASVIKIAEALSRNTTLEELRIPKNKMTNIGAKALAKMLKRNATLKVLDISGNNILPLFLGLSAAEYEDLHLFSVSPSFSIPSSAFGGLPLALKKNTTLKEFYIGTGKPITDDLMEDAFLGALTGHKKSALTVLDVVDTIKDHTQYDVSARLSSATAEGAVYLGREPSGGFCVVQ